MEPFMQWLKAKNGDFKNVLRDRLLSEEKETLNFMVDQYASSYHQEQINRVPPAQDTPVTPYDGRR